MDRTVCLNDGPTPKSLLVLVLLLLTSGWTGGQESPPVPFLLPTPDGWRTETIPFPLPFAPDLQYVGLEELRFAPGMFDPESEDSWTYAFVWWLPLGTAIDRETLESDLEAYFRGLTQAVAESGDFDPGNPSFVSRVRELDAPDGGNRRFQGQFETFELAP